MCLRLSHVSHPASKLLSFVWSEGHIFGQVVMPVLFKGQVSLVGSLDWISIFEQLNLDLWWVEATHVTDEDIGFICHSWSTAVDLNLGWSFFGQRRDQEAEHADEKCADKQLHLFTVSVRWKS